MKPDYAAEYNAGSSIDGLARKYNINRTRMRRILLNLNVKLRPRGGNSKFTPQQIQERAFEAIKLYADGEIFVTEILKQTGISLSTFYLHLKKHNVSLRRGQHRR